MLGIQKGKPRMDYVSIFRILINKLFYEKK